MVDGAVATRDIVRLELPDSIRSAGGFRALHSDLGALPDCPLGKDEWLRALEASEELAHLRGLDQRALRHGGLLIASAADAAGVAVLHYDEDFDRIGAVTGQAVRWLAPRGSLG